MASKARAALKGKWRARPVVPVCALIAVVVLAVGCPATPVGTTEERLAALEAQVAALQTELDAAQAQLAALDTGFEARVDDCVADNGYLTQVHWAGVLGKPAGFADGVDNASVLDPYVAVQEGALNGMAGPHVIFTGVNVHIRSGTDQTGPAVNGRGNLIIGYNETPEAATHGRDGSHNLVVGPFHQYASYGGFVAGETNIVSGPYATVSGGFDNLASGLTTSVSGGSGNTASGDNASVGGGADNDATGENASVSGGFDNTASGEHASISGGSTGSAGGYCSAIGGGINNEASAYYASVSGGDSNNATGHASSVAGGVNNTAEGNQSAVSGGIWNEASGRYSTVSGGHGLVADTEDAHLP